LIKIFLEVQTFQQVEIWTAEDQEWKENVRSYPENLGYETLEKENKKLVKNMVEEEEVNTILFNSWPKV
jgi:hypothetical protein